MTYCLLWLFMWDDEIDSRDASLGSDFEGAQRYRKTTLAYVAKALNLMDDAPIPDLSATTNVLITGFSDIANAVSSKDKQQRRRLYKEVEYLVQSTEVEQARRSEVSLPTLEEYIETRMGTSAVRVLCVLFDILTGPSFDSSPCFTSSKRSSHTSSQCLEIMTNQTNLLISITNDILSVKKEVAVGAPDSIIPILWLESRKLAEALVRTVGLLEKARRVFDEAEQKMLRSCWNEMAIGEIIGALQYVEALKTSCTGNVAWSMRSRRYGLSSLAGQREKVIVL
ncbi:hypothetical protein OHC33_004487 [Knufia fluminis]|uniref:Terpene synthase n=1 Tax=Knufia fluminis TaxID=191047 RepID=A0AAN8EN59_9EURO|nr:hypothetical protein OHC33_004487 [Knufia fluminis]